MYILFSYDILRVAKYIRRKEEDISLVIKHQWLSVMLLSLGLQTFLLPVVWHWLCPLFPFILRVLGIFPSLTYTIGLVGCLGLELLLYYFLHPFGVVLGLFMVAR